MVCRRCTVRHESPTPQIEMQWCAVLFTDIGYRWSYWVVTYRLCQCLAWMWCIVYIFSSHHNYIHSVYSML